MGKQGFSVAKLANQIVTEADAYLLLEKLRWDGAPDACPHCGGMGRCYYLTPRDGTTSRSTRTGSRSQRRVWKCGHCRKQFSVLTGTILHGTKISVRTWLFVIFEMCASKNGVAAREIERKYSVTAKSAWFMLHRIREAMRREPLAGLLSGVVQADETFVGGKPHNRHRNDRREATRGYATTDQTPVFALVDTETREVRSRVVANVNGQSLRQVILEEVQADRTVLHTDSHAAYRVVARDLRGHAFVDHSRGEYVRKDRSARVSTNFAEGYFSQLKRSVDGTHHHVSVEHLHRYLAQFDFMYTHCRATDSARMRLLLDRVGGRRLTYKPLTSGHESR